MSTVQEIFHNFGAFICICAKKVVSLHDFCAHMGNAQVYIRVIEYNEIWIF